MNCPRCGRPLAEGEICNCAANEAFPAPPAPMGPEAPAAPPAPEFQDPSAPFTAPPMPPQPEAAPFQPQAQPAYAPPVAAPVVARTDYPEGYKIKKKYVAVILGWTLGAFGIHNFYLGNQGKAIAQLLICLIGGFLLFGLGYIAAAIWAVIDTVQILTEDKNMDANGFKIMTFEESLVRTKMEAEKNAE